MACFKKMICMMLAFLVAASALAAPAHAWWNPDWKYRKSIAVDTSPSGVNMSGVIGRSVVLVRLHSGNFTFTDTAQNGADIRFVDSDDKTPLPFHIEQFDATTGIATVWVSVPNLNGGEKRQLWLYFGNPNAPVAQDVAGTFDPDYSAVYHFDDNPGQPSSDKTANANNAVNSPPALDDSGIIGRSARFPGQGSLTIAPSPSLAIPAASPFTFSVWVKPERLDGAQAIFARGGLVIGIDAGVPFAEIGGASRVQATGALKQGDWSSLAVVADGETVRIYVNGIEAGAASVALPALDGPIALGGTADRLFVGALDEARLSRVARPANMLLAMAQAEGPAGKLVGVSETAEEQSHGGGTFFFVLSKVETIDAVIIGICMFMLAVGIAVMVSKSRYLATAEKANARFMDRFRELHEQLQSFTKRRDIEPNELKFLAQSPLYRLYEVGVEELEVRRPNLNGRSLSGESVEAMRAAIDAVVVDENQRLDKWMVLLTIAISGGPFIGLLGTVMGVMNTFGGVALAGDVNVNAIAPGIAAALMATIAGLACAIPALFGYNYLNTRISAMADQMRVFVDRLITRLAEMQHEGTPPPMQMAAE